METKYEIIPLFPTPLYINEVPKQLVQDHIKYLDNELIQNDSENKDLLKNFGSKSKNTYILNQPQYQNLSNYIIQHSTNFAENYIGYGYKKYKFSQSWISIKSLGEQHLPHYHPNSLISGILFYGKFVDKTSHITFCREDEFSKSTSSHAIVEEKLNNPFNSLEYKIPFQSNLLLLFPSYLRHTVSENITNIPRKSLAFNIIPRDGFGVEDFLTELKFN